MLRPPPTPVHKNTLLVVPPTHPLKSTYFIDSHFYQFKRLASVSPLCVHQLIEIGHITVKCVGYSLFASGCVYFLTKILFWTIHSEKTTYFVKISVLNWYYILVIKYVQRLCSKIYRKLKVLGFYFTILLFLQTRYFSAKIFKWKKVAELSKLSLPQSIPVCLIRHSY